MSNELLVKLKETEKKIVGKWYCEQIDQHLEFSLIEGLHKPADLKIINTQTYNTQYTLSARPHFIENRTRGLYYISIEPFPNREYDILSITDDMLVLSEIIEKFKSSTGITLIYKRPEI